MANKKTAVLTEEEIQTDKEHLQLVLAKHREEKQKMKPKKERGRGGSGNFPSSRDRYKGSPEVIKQILTETLAAYNMPRVRNNAELAQRINDYFLMCAETGQIPTIEELALSTGYSYKTWAEWASGENKGFDDCECGKTADIIKKAKAFMHTFDSKMALSGQVDFLLYCFRGKNYYGMTDKQEVTITPNTNPIGDPKSQQALLDEYLEHVDDT